MSTNDLETNDNVKAKIRAPKEAYLFFPTFTEEIDWNALYPYKTLRYIFEKSSLDQYLPFEVEKYEELRQSSQFTSITLPSIWNQAMVMKCLQASKFNISKTIALITKLLSLNIPQLKYDSYKEILESGFLYLHGLDTNYRPIIITKASIYLELAKRYSYDHFICAIDYFINYLCEKIFIHGQVENWIMIADVSNMTMLKPPLSLLNVFSFLSLKYLCRLSKLYVYNMSSMLNLCWTVIQKFLDEGTVKKFVFVHNKNKDQILTHVNPSQLENKYGGICPNRTEYKEIFYLPSRDYLTDENKMNAKYLISEERYIERAIDGGLVDISPYLIEEINNRRQLNNTIYTVALTQINDNIIVDQNESIILIKGDDHDDEDNNRHCDNREKDIDLDSRSKEKENDELKSVNHAKVRDEDYDTADFSMSNSNHILSSKRTKYNDIETNKNMKTIFESKEEYSYCCYNNNNQNAGLSSCIII